LTAFEWEDEDIFAHRGRVGDGEFIGIGTRSGSDDTGRSATTGTEVADGGESLSG
jgi:hypothetical protein